MNQMNQQGIPLRPPEGDYYAQSSTPGHKQEITEMMPSTMLIFRDQHTLEVQNYAIVGQMLWSFGPGTTQKIPLSDLDIPATTKANENRGLDFRLPGGAG